MYLLQSKQKSQIILTGHRVYFLNKRNKQDLTRQRDLYYRLLVAFGH